MGLDLSSKKQKFRNLSSARHKRGTPRSLWVDSPSNATMTDIILNCSNKGPSAILREREHLPEYPTLPDLYEDKRNMTREDEEWKLFLKEREMFQRTCKQHYLELEESAKLNKPTIVPHVSLSRKVLSKDEKHELHDGRTMKKYSDTKNIVPDLQDGAETTTCVARPLSAPVVTKPMFPRIKEEFVCARPTYSPLENTSNFD